MDDPRAPEPHELARITEFLEGELRPNKEWSIASEYPQVFANDNIHNIRFIEDDKRVVSHAALNVSVIKTPYAVFKVGGIGSVVTHPKYRHQGISKKVIGQCLDLAIDQDCDLCILWSDLFDFYAKMDFALAGHEVALMIDKPMSDLPAHQLKFHEGNKVAPAALLRLYSQHTVGAVRSTADIQRYLNIPNSQVFTAWSPANELLAYAVMGKGADLQGYVHEWGGQVPCLVHLFQHILESKKSQITVISPLHAQNLITALVKNGARQHIGFLGLLRVMDPQKFFAKIHKVARQNGVANFVLQENTFGVDMGLGRDVINWKSITDILPIIFGHQNAQNMGRYKQQTQQELGRILPLPLWVWGWDSV